MFIPIGTDNSTVWRTPWVTFTLIAINILVFIFTYPMALQDDERLLKQAEELVLYVRNHPELWTEDYLEELQAAGIPAAECEFLRQLRYEYGDYGPMEESGGGVTTFNPSEYHKLLDQFIAARQDNLNHHYGYVPNEHRYWDVFTSMFMHGDAWHLLGNMLFFFAVGFSLEDLWGRAFFSGFYLASGVAAALTHSFMFPDSGIPLIGASGAIAGVMGAFLIRLYRAKIKIFYIYISLWWMMAGRWPIGTFYAPAVVFLPLWFLLQLLFGWLTQDIEVGVAYWAHIGGFAFGMIFASAVKLTRLEEHILKPAIDAKVEFGSSRSVTAALELLEQGKTQLAEQQLNAYLAKAPSDVNALLALVQVHERNSNQEHLRRTYARLVRQYVNLRDRDAALIAYDSLLNTYEEAEPILPLGIREWMTICEYLVELEMHQAAAVEYRRIGRALKLESFAAKALLLSGEIFLNQLNNPKEALTSFKEAYQMQPVPPQWLERIKAGLEKIQRTMGQATGTKTPQAQPPGSALPAQPEIPPITL